MDKKHKCREQMKKRQDEQDQNSELKQQNPKKRQKDKEESKNHLTILERMMLNMTPPIMSAKKPTETVDSAEDKTIRFN